MNDAEKRRYLAATASLGVCVRCGAWGVQVAHRNEGKGMGQKTAPYETAALCPECHHRIDNGKEMTHEERRAEFNAAEVETHRRLFAAGVFILNPEWKP